MGTGITMLVLSIIGWFTVWFLVGFAFWTVVGIWAIVDFCFIVSGHFKDSKGMTVSKW
jgi:hypothetical protein